MNALEIDGKIICYGDYSVFDYWHENAGIDIEDFLDGLKWMQEDPMPEGIPTRELGCELHLYGTMTEEEWQIWGDGTPYAERSKGKTGKLVAIRRCCEE